MFLIGLCLPALANMLDNVFRQADKLIVKPETYNLVIKDKATFKVFLQNNMDRGIADISLIAESPAFDFVVKPQRMSIQQDQKTYFEVTMTPKTAVKTGNYTINFRLVGGDDKRLFKSFSMKMAEAEEPAKATAKSTDVVPKDANTVTPTPASPVTRPSSAKANTQPVNPATPTPPSDNPAAKTLFATARSATEAPVIDGTLNDSIWERAAVLSGFSSDSGGQAVYDTTAQFTFDKDMLYLSVLCSDEDISLLRESDFIEIRLSKNYPNSLAYSIKLTSGNTASFKILSHDKPDGRWIPSGLDFATEKAGRSWSMELAIPFSAIGTPAPRTGEKWQLRINRNKASGNTEQTFWAADELGANSPKGFGVIGFAP